MIIVGAGPIGVSLAAYLSQVSPESVLLATRIPSPDSLLSIRLDKLSKEAITIETTILSQAPNSELIIFAVKAHDLRNATKEILHSISPETKILVASNGLDVINEIVDLVPNGISVGRLLLSYGVRFVEDRLVMSGDPRGVLAAKDISSGRWDKEIGLFRRAGFEITTNGSVAEAEWEKLLSNLVVNTLCTLYDQPNEAIIRDIKIQARAKDIFDEYIAVSRAVGHNINDLTFERFLKLIENHGQNINSTLIDLRCKRRTELPWIVGKFAETANRVGIAIPATERVIEELSKLNINC